MSRHRKPQHVNDWGSGSARSTSVLVAVRDATGISTTSASWMVKLALDNARGSEISTSSQKTSASSWTSKIAAARVDSTSRTGVAEGASFVMAAKRSGSMCVRLVVARDDTVNIQAYAAEARGRSWAVRR